MTKRDNTTGELDLKGYTPAELATMTADKLAETIRAARPANRFNRFSMALAVQDAGNLRAIARSFVEVCDDAMAELNATTLVWEDPAVRLFAAKIHELCGLGFADSYRYGDALNACRAKCEPKKESV